MARKVINTGTNYNDGTGDLLRDAMSKVNENFEELYSISEFSTNIAFDANKISTLNANGNLTIDPNGTGQLRVNSGAIINAAQQPSGLFIVKDSVGNDLFSVDPLLRSIGINTAPSDPGLNIAGNLTVEGNSSVINTNVTLGNVGKLVRIAGELNSNIIPTLTDTFIIGTEDKKFSNGWFSSLAVDTANIASIYTTDVYSANVAATNEIISGNLIMRGNEITNAIIDQDININPYGIGNLRVNTRMVVGQGESPLGEAIIKAVENVDGYIQSTLQNLNSGPGSSADLFIPRDDGDDEDKFIDIGINSSNYSNPEEFRIHTAGSAYIYTSSADMFISTYSEHDIVFSLNGMEFENISMRMKGATGNIIIGHEDPSSEVEDTGEHLQVKDSARFAGTIAIASSTPSTSIGVEGDQEGMVCWDSDYIYVCTANYDGSTNIWKRSSLGGTW